MNVFQNWLDKNPLVQHTIQSAYRLTLASVFIGLVSQGQASAAVEAPMTGMPAAMFSPAASVQMLTAPIYPGFNMMMDNYVTQYSPVGKEYNMTSSTYPTPQPVAEGSVSEPVLLGLAASASDFQVLPDQIQHPNAPLDSDEDPSGEAPMTEGEFPEDGKLNFITPVDNARISSHYGWRGKRMHKGIDYAVPSGVPIKAAEKGVVTYSGWESGYGNFVVLDHGDGITTRYGHASKLLVHAGQEVAQGDTIALVGSTGHSTGPHLHFEVLTQEKHRNPIAYVNHSLTVQAALN